MHSYRKKTLLNYQDLSLIYGNEVINGYQGHMHQDTNFEDGILRVKTGEFNLYFGKRGLFSIAYEVCTSEISEIFHIFQ